MVTLFDQEKVWEIYEYNVVKEAREQGAMENMLASIRNPMKNVGWPVEQAMTVLDVPEEERPKYLELLEDG